MQMMTVLLSLVLILLFHFHLHAVCICVIFIIVNLQKESGGPELDKEKAALIEHVLDLQTTLDALSQRVDTVRQDNAELKRENQQLTQVIENMMASAPSTRGVADQGKPST
eukprot:m.59186 g.59186  ORF g.59186 m.59186 type:complete len:111 (+) comp13210_c0_seq2:154-486(+)